MRAPCLAEATHEDVVARLEIEHLEPDAALAQLVEDARELVEEVALADVEPERNAAHLLARGLPQLDESGDQRNRKIVDAVEAEVLEDLDRGALPRSGEAGHDDQPEVPHGRSRARLRVAIS